MNVNNIEEALARLPAEKQYICSVYDVKEKRHSSVMVYNTVESAIRSFGNACRQENHEFKQNAEDFSLWMIGLLNPSTGKIEIKDPMQLAAATEFKK